MKHSVTKNLICRIFSHIPRKSQLLVHILNSRTTKTSWVIILMKFCSTFLQTKQNVKGQLAGQMRLLWHVCGEFVSVLADDLTSPLTVQPVWDSKTERWSTSVLQTCDCAEVLNMNPVQETTQQQLRGVKRRCYCCSSACRCLFIHLIFHFL